MKILYVPVLVLLASCAATDGARITYTQQGTDMIATLSDGTALRVPCMLSTTSTVTRIGKEVDNCEIAQENRQIILERQREITAREQQAAVSP
jgi:uncharacterized protein (UPF0179 family)